LLRGCCGLFFEGDGLALGIELDHAVALGIGDVVGEDGGA
jgi:hypothetical protein